MGRGANRLKEQIARVLEADDKQMTRIWDEILKTVLAESQCTIREVLSNVMSAA